MLYLVINKKGDKDMSIEDLNLEELYDKLFDIHLERQHKYAIMRMEVENE